MDIDKITDGPIKQSTTSVFDTLNQKTEAVDLLNKYKNANSELVKTLVENVQILGMTEPVKLAGIYSVTKISTTIHRRLYSDEWIDISSKHEVKANKNHATLRADAYIDKHNRVVILAGPGSGKTTLLKYTALSYIDKKLFKNSELTVQKTPFYVSLPDLLESELSIEEYLSNKIKIKTHEFAKFYLKRLLVKGKAAVLLDSLDEVPLSQRNKAYERIEELSNLYAKTKIVLTCRIADYDRTLEGFYEVEISRLTEKAINKIIRAWFTGRPKKARELIRHLSIDKDVYSLTETPLLLSLLCIQYSNDLNIPNRKTELYSRCIDAFLRSWDTSRGFRRDTAFSSLTDDRKEKLFSEIAYEFLCNKEGKYVFHERELLENIGNFVERFGMLSNESDSILKEIESHHGILEKYTAESFSFSHVSFQEYFSAVALVSKRLELKFVKKYLSNPRGIPVIIFMVALMDDPSPVLQVLMEKSSLLGIKTYPAMKSRTEVLSLLYRCMNSGVAMSPSLRIKIYKHIANSQIKISSIFRKADTYPIAKLEDDGLSYTYYYRGKTRKTLNSTLVSFRKLSNEILLSPNEKYTAIALDLFDKTCAKETGLIGLCMKSCMFLPLCGSEPNKILQRLESLNEDIKGDRLLSLLAEGSIDKIKSNYIKYF